MKKHTVKIDYSIKRNQITKELIQSYINKLGRVDPNLFKKLSFNFTSEEAYLIYNNTRTVKCLECNKSAVFISFTKGYRKYCSKKCAFNSKKRTENIISTSVKNNSYEIGVQKMIKTKEKKYEGYNVFNSDKDLYYNLVSKITRKQNIKQLKNIEKRGAYKNNKNAYHLDHKYSKHYGYINNIPPFIIGNICNLQMLPALENSGVKNKQCSITLDKLLEEFYNF